MKIDDWSNWSKSDILSLLRWRTFLNYKLVLQWNNFLKKQNKQKTHVDIPRRQVHPVPCNLNSDKSFLTLSNLNHIYLAAGPLWYHASIGIWTWVHQSVSDWIWNMANWTTRPPRPVIWLPLLMEFLFNIWVLRQKVLNL